MFKKFRNKFKQEIDAITGFLFIALVFYLLYFSLWVILPLWIICLTFLIVENI